MLRRKLIWLLMGLLASIAGAFRATIGTPWELLCPGETSAELSSLDGRFSEQLTPILDQLESEGFSVSVSDAYRSHEKQRCYLKISKAIKEYTGQNGFTTVYRSCHNNVRAGEPASLAVDLRVNAGWIRSREEEAAFYLRLRELVRSAKGLKSGGDFLQSNPRWAEHGLGWDPGHVEVRGCEGRLKIE